MKAEFDRILYDFERSHKLGYESTHRLLRALASLAQEVERLDRRLERTSVGIPVSIPNYVVREE